MGDGITRAACTCACCARALKHMQKHMLAISPLLKFDLSSSNVAGCLVARAESQTLLAVGQGIFERLAARCAQRSSILLSCSKLLQATEEAEAPFALLWVRHALPHPCNHGAFGVKLRQLVCGPIATAFVSNFQIDFAWLASACPELSEARRLIVVHGLDAEMVQGEVAAVTQHWAAQVRAVRLPVACTMRCNLSGVCMMRCTVMHSCAMRPDGCA